MKRVRNFGAAIISMFTLFILTGCAKFPDGTSAWSGGLGVIPFMTATGAVIFGYQAYKSSKSNSTTTLSSGEVIQNTGNVPIYKIGLFYFAVALAVATAIIIIMINGNK